MRLYTDMHKKIGYGIVSRFLCLLVLVGLVLSGNSQTSQSAASSEQKPLWLDDFSMALFETEMSGRPIIIYFYSESSPQCKQFFEETLTAEQLLPPLSKFVPLRQEIEVDKAIADEFFITTIPSLIVLSQSGYIVDRCEGPLSLDEVNNFLLGAMSAESSAYIYERAAELLAKLGTRGFPEHGYEELILALAEPRLRGIVNNRLVFLKDFPRQKFVEMLESPRLAVRSGALEILEEVAGTNFNFDPWRSDMTEEAVKKALQKWKAWTENDAGTVEIRFAALSSENLKAALANLFSDDRDRSTRALRRLLQSGQGILPALDRYTENNPELPVVRRRQIDQLRYALALNENPAVAAVRLSRQLVFGSLETRMAAIHELRKAGTVATPILCDLLGASVALVREAAVITLADIAGAQAIPILKDHLQNETDVDVVVAIVRALGATESKRAEEILHDLLGSDNPENVVLSALQALQRFDTEARYNEKIAECFNDPRWRVRAAALETAVECRFKQASKLALKLLDDDDAYVRTAAIKTVAATMEKRARPKLIEVAKKHPDMAPFVIECLLGIESSGTLPDEVNDILVNSPQHEAIRLITVANRSHLPPVLKPVISEFAKRKENKTVQKMALRTMARFDWRDYDVQNSIADYLETAAPSMQAEVLEGLCNRYWEKSYLWASSERERYLAFWIPSGEKTTSKTDKRKEDSPATALLSAFTKSGSNVPVSLEPEEVQAPTSADLMTAFGLDGSSVSSTISITKSGSTSSRLKFVVNNLCSTTSDDRVKALAGVVLAHCGDFDHLDFALDHFFYIPQEAKGQLAAVMVWQPRSPKVKDVVEAMLSDPAVDIRKMGGALALDPQINLLSVVLDNLQKPGTDLNYEDLFGYTSSMDRIEEDAFVQIKVAPVLAAAVLQAKTPELKIIALELMGLCGRFGKSEIAETHLDSKNPYIRRAAYHSLLSINPRQAAKHADNIITDPSPLVREVFIDALSQDRDWAVLLNQDSKRENTVRRQQNVAHVFINRKEQLTKLRRDADPTIRLEAMIFYCANGGSLEPRELGGNLRRFDSIEHGAEVLGNWLSEYSHSPLFRKLKRNASFLKALKAELPTLEQYYPSIRKANYIRELIGESSEGSTSSALTAGNDQVLSFSQMSERYSSNTARKNPSTPIVQGNNVRTQNPSNSTGGDEKIDQQEPEHTEALPLTQPSQSPVKIVFFYSPGCQECRKVEAWLGKASSSNPRLKVDDLDITLYRNVPYNEFLCGQFDVSGAKRQVTPAVFTAAGALIGDDLTYSALIQLLRRAEHCPPGTWVEMPEEKAEEAVKKLESKYDAITVSVIVGNGLVDGVNPCAFATIIFLLSYLQVTRRTPRETAAAGIAFVAAVYITYFLLGLGLARIITELSAFELAARYLQIGTVIFAGVVMLLCIYDGILCLRGRIDEMVLQLPGVFKERIRATVRTHARSKYIIPASFGVGVLISMLEIACTGQNYLPTILFMLQRGGKGTAWGYLVLYNLAFVLPLIIVFTLAFFGLRSEKLTPLLKKHAATVKFALAILFGIMITLLIANA